MHCAGGVCPGRGVSAQGGVCPGGICPGGSTQWAVCGRPPVWTEWQTGVKTLPFRNFIADGNNCKLDSPCQPAGYNAASPDLGLRSHWRWRNRWEPESGCTLKYTNMSTILSHNHYIHTHFPYIYPYKHCIHITRLTPILTTTTATTTFLTPTTSIPILKPSTSKAHSLLSSP